MRGTQIFGTRFLTQFCGPLIQTQAAANDGAGMPLRHITSRMALRWHGSPAIFRHLQVLIHQDFRIADHTDSVPLILPTLWNFPGINLEGVSRASALPREDFTVAALHRSTPARGRTCRLMRYALTRRLFARATAFAKRRRFDFDDFIHVQLLRGPAFAFPVSKRPKDQLVAISALARYQQPLTSDRVAH